MGTFDTEIPIWSANGPAHALRCFGHIFIKTLNPNTFTLFGHAIMLCGRFITLCGNVIMLCGYVITLYGHAIMLYGHVIMLCGHVITLRGYVIMFEFHRQTSIVIASMPTGSYKETDFDILHL